MTRIAITLGDVVLLSRYAARFHGRQRKEKCQHLVERAQEAADFVALTGMAHPFLGDGSIGGLAIRKGLGPMKATLSLDELACFARALEALCELWKDPPNLTKR